MSADERCAVYCGTPNLYSDMVTASKSLFCNSNVDTVYFVISTSSFPYSIPPCVKIIDMSNQQFFRTDGVNYWSRWTYMVLLRAALAKIFPKIDKILSLDVDTIVDNDISELWDIDIDNYYFAAVREPSKSIGTFLYTNFGVTMQNLRKLRNDRKVDEVIKKLNYKKYSFLEQDAMNIECQGRILEIPAKYNVACCTSETVEDPRIIHYAAVKEWNNKPLVEKYRKMSWEEALGDRKVYL